MMKRFQTQTLISMLIGALLFGACGSAPEQPAAQQAKPTEQRKPAEENKAATPNSSPNPSTVLIPATSKLEKIRVGHNIPEFKVNDINGQSTTIASRDDAEGELIVVYAPNCSVCHATIPRWVEMYRQ